MKNYSEILEKYKSYDLVLNENGCLKTAIEAYSPYTTYDGKDFGGSCLRIYNIIMEKLGLCYELIKSPEGIWGNEFPNGSWNGLIGLAQRKEVETIICPVVTLYRRYLAIDYSEYVISSDYVIVYPRPTVHTNLAGFVMPFHYQTWILIFMTCLFLTGLSFLLNKSLFKRLNSLIRLIRPEDDLAYIPNDSWFRGLLAQPSTIMPKEVGSRILLVIWLLTTFVLQVTFRCNLKALMIVPKIHESCPACCIPSVMRGCSSPMEVEIPFNNLEELVNQDEYKWSFLDGSIIPQVFRPAYEEDPNSVMGRGWSHRGELYPFASDIREFVVDRGMACIAITSKVDEVYSDDFSLSGKCRLASANERLLKVELAYGLKKKSKFAELFNPYIRNMRAMGILDKIFGEDTVNATYCKVPPGSEIGFKERPLAVGDFLGIFSLLGAGYVLATIVFLVEIMMKKKKMN